jgi:hypothetical protein
MVVNYRKTYLGPQARNDRAARDAVQVTAILAVCSVPVVH